ncbi:Methyltransferase domain-containing protein [Cnuella takakiae]|uniref:Methyltransferase domain-containing protein n=1 Tax=Cnuella takakiae TaxID=1302690 RepID=A0A1M5A885_9BACT|nr:class I SAM-dependent methyltransferase [Cnuella takakiae]OLY92058.1 methyltransferase type 11 [Cnuella takakiae]SHF26459.1 Methyltransferase domain-containing protein [Cnuella takakiae]
MAANEWYKQWFNSPFYHQLYFGRDAGEASRLVTNLLQHLQPAAGSLMLDVACGKGRHSRLLAEAGFDVTGIDIAPDSIAEASRQEKDNLHFYVHDMRLPFWINYFDYAFNFFTSFGYFPTRREHDDAMRTIAASLKKGGTVVFDYLNAHYVEDHLVHNEEKTIGDVVYDIHRWHDEEHFFKKITVNAPSLSGPLAYTEKVAKFSLGDFTDMLSFQGLQVTEVFGDYDLNGYDVRKTPRMIVLAQKQ